MALEANRNYRVQIWLLPTMVDTWWSISTEDTTGLLGTRRVQTPAASRQDKGTSKEDAQSQELHFLPGSHSIVHEICFHGLR